ncbi:hypothetical protein [Rossellomorea aquimaris]|uniref:hypothetical protein n=1 Tax=Rossellomorea aquimaris TaxID=189382 RepID=UPI0007D048ED|nr:hypothetical protein [Rossellomorea aquimaris]
MPEQKELLDLLQYRQKKQQIAEEQIKELYANAYDYALKETNIREKVRGKMIFSKRFQLKEPSLVSDRAEKLFLQWFLFDYKTIKGQTLFFQFLQSQQLTEPTRMLGVLVLTAAWEPLILKNWSDEEDYTILEGLNIIHNNVEQMKMEQSGFEQKMERESLYFVRKVPLVTHQWVLGPLFHVDSRNTLPKMKEQYSQMNQKTGVLWRTYLKEEAPNFILSSHL